ncbi:hypothetical protein BGZ76_002068 [Entomortierella beljakovae]|nr:hypothetical protein BGZ76_002068 [Entomortierella beljakovae]
MEFPKIRVSSKADIEHITQIWRTALFESFEQQGTKLDPKRRLIVGQLLDQWVDNMIKMASSNIEINGIPYEQAIANEEYEPLDESLSRKLQAQQLKVEEMTLQVAERRKRVPEQVKMLLDDALRRQAAHCDRVEYEPENLAEFESENTGAEKAFEKATLNRPELVAEEYTSSMKLLSDLRKTVSSNITRIESAQAVVDEILP